MDMKTIIVTVTQSNFFRCLIVLVVMDVIFGCLRAIKEHSFNSCVGINGMIRKAGMLISLICMVYLDLIVSLNLIGFIPEAIRSYLPADKIGIMEFFAIIYIIYEVISVLKNMSLSGLPVEKIWQAVSGFLRNTTSEIAETPDEDGDEK